MNGDTFELPTTSMLANLDQPSARAKQEQPIQTGTSVTNEIKFEIPFYDKVNKTLTYHIREKKWILPR